MESGGVVWVETVRVEVVGVIWANVVVGVSVVGEGGCDDIGQEYLPMNKK